MECEVGQVDGEQSPPQGSQYLYALATRQAMWDTFFRSFTNSRWTPSVRLPLRAGRSPASCSLCDHPATSMAPVKPSAEFYPEATYAYRIWIPGYETLGRFPRNTLHGLAIKSYRGSPFKVRSPNSAMGVDRLLTRFVCGLTSRSAVKINRVNSWLPPRSSGRAIESKVLRGRPSEVRCIGWTGLWWRGWGDSPATGTGR